MSFLTDIWGKIPEVAKYTPTDFGAEQLKAIKENISAFPEIGKLGSLFQDYMTSSYSKLIPQLSSLFESGGEVTQDMLDTAKEFLGGNVPKDVLDKITRSSAYQAITGGFAGSAMAGANAARNLGLTSLDMVSKGAALAGQAGNAAQQWMALASNMIMNPSGMLVTPQQQAALTMQNNLYKQATQQRKFNMEAMPDPATRGIHDTVINLIGSYLGHGMGGGSTAPQQLNFGQGSFNTTSEGSQSLIATAFPEDFTDNTFNTVPPVSFNEPLPSSYDPSKDYVPANFQF